MGAETVSTFKYFDSSSRMRNHFRSFTSALFLFRRDEHASTCTLIVHIYVIRRTLKCNNARSIECKWRFFSHQQILNSILFTQEEIDKAVTCIAWEIIYFSVTGIHITIDCPKQSLLNTSLGKHIRIMVNTYPLISKT